MADYPEVPSQASTSDPQARPRRDMKEVGQEDRFSDSSGVLFEQAMAQTRMAVCLSDPHQPDQPIVFANRAFRRLTGTRKRKSSAAIAGSCKARRRTAMQSPGCARPSKTKTSWSSSC